ncbi:MAG: ribonuclease P [Flavobacteriales bacterium]|nr:ribonuclease P [Flavobacteriales bacterium]
MGIPRKHRLKSRKSIQRLFSHGVRLKAYPVHLLFYLEPDAKGSAELSIACSAPRRIHRRAVMRNRWKRRLKEAIRPLIPDLLTSMDHSGHRLDMMLIYVGKDELTPAEIQIKIKVLLDRLKEYTYSPDTDAQNQDLA